MPYEIETPYEIAERWVRATFGHEAVKRLEAEIYAYAERRVEEFRAEMERRIARILK